MSGLKYRAQFHRSRVLVTAPSINYKLHIFIRKGHSCTLPLTPTHLMLENPQQSWILDSMLWIPDPLSVQLGFQILISSRIPDSLSYSRFHSPRILDFYNQNLTRFWVPLAKISQSPDSLTSGDSVASFVDKTDLELSLSNFALLLINYRYYMTL